MITYNFCKSYMKLVSCRKYELHKTERSPSHTLVFPTVDSLYPSSLSPLGQVTEWEKPQNRKEVQMFETHIF